MSAARTFIETHVVGSFTVKEGSGWRRRGL
jgi:hypothetical protein